MEDLTKYNNLMIFLRLDFSFPTFSFLSPPPILWQTAAASHRCFLTDARRFAPFQATTLAIFETSLPDL